MSLWIRGEKEELINAAMVSVLRVQREQGTHALMAVMFGGGAICLVRGTEVDCKRRLEQIHDELTRVGVRFA
jgi:hypothetical protein